MSSIRNWFGKSLEGGKGETAPVLSSRLEQLPRIRMFCRTDNRFQGILWWLMTAPSKSQLVDAENLSYCLPEKVRAITELKQILISAAASAAEGGTCY